MAKLLDDAQRRAYRMQGIVYPIRVLDAKEVQRFRAHCDELETQLGGEPRTIEVRQMHLHFRWAYELATHPRVLDAVEDLLGPNVLVWATELFAKHPHQEAISIGFHRDRPYMGFDDGAEVLTGWIALTESTLANGCMLAVPGPDRCEGDPSEWPKINTLDSESIPSDFTPVVLEAGEMSLHDVDIPHGSTVNGSLRKRTGFVVRYVTSAAQPQCGRPPAILARGRDEGDFFQMVDPPDEIDPLEALSRMRESAARHFEAMLGNVTRSES